jgi:hypothetical protein
VALVDDVVADYCKRVGAVPPKARDDGSYVLQFEDKYDIELSSSARDQVLLRSNLPKLTRDDRRTESLRRLMRINLALSERKRSSLTLDAATDTPFLYDMVAVTAGDMAASARSITGFVNEVAAFDAVLTRSRQT